MAFTPSCGGGGSSTGTPGAEGGSGGGAPAPVSAIKIGSDFYARAIAFDPAGDVYVAAYAANGCTLGGQPCTGTAIAKLDPTGKLVWSKPTTDEVSIAADSTGVVVSDADGTSKYDPGGTMLWRDPTSAAMSMYFPALAALPNGRALLASGVLDLADASGKVTTRGMLPGQASAMTLDATGAVYVAGATSPSANSLFVVKYDASFTQVWSKTYPVAAGCTGCGVSIAMAVDAQGRPVVVGVAHAAFDVGGGSMGENGALYALALDGTGGVRWSTTTSGGLFNDAEPIGDIVSPSGNVVVLGNTNGPVTLGGQTAGTQTGYQAVLGELDSSGTTTWLRDLDSPYAGPVATDPAGRLALVTSPAHCPVDFGGGGVACTPRDTWLVVYPM